MTCWPSPGTRTVRSPRHRRAGRAARVVLETWVEGGSGVESAAEADAGDASGAAGGGTHNAAGIAGLLEGVRFVLEQGVERIRAARWR